MKTKKIETIPIEFIDSQRLKDRLVSGGSVPPKNRVQIHERVKKGRLYKPKSYGGKVMPYSLDTDPRYGKIEDTNNLIVYKGRSWLMQRAFQKDLSPVGGWPNANYVKNTSFISWFGLGSGGADPENPLTPYEPALTDIGLASHEQVNTGDRRSYDFNDNQYHAFDTGYPVFISDINVDITNNESCTVTDPVTTEDRACNSFLIALVRVTVEADEYNGGTTDDDYADINEAGLFTSWSNTNGVNHPVYQTPELFARVCFSTIRKSSSREMIFSWYVYF